MTFHEANKAFTRADLAWGKELVAVFGEEAGAARYQKCGRGRAGSNLRALWVLRELSREEFLLIRNSLFPHLVKESAE